MTDDRDPTLRALFADATEDLVGEAFTAQVMSQIKMSHRADLAKIGIGLGIAACLLLLAAPLQDVVQGVTQRLAPLSLVVSLIDVDNQYLAQMLSPVNNVAAVVALGLIGLRFFYRKVAA
jgi:hypothetical protein